LAATLAAAVAAAVAVVVVEKDSELIENLRAEGKTKWALLGHIM